MDVFRKFYLTLDDGFLKLCNSFTIMLFDLRDHVDILEISKFLHHMKVEKGMAFRYYRLRPVSSRLVVDGRTVKEYFTLQKEDGE
jgi:hypothetical protein